MTLRQYLITMAIAALFCWGAFGMILVNADPFEANMPHFLFFYSSLSLAILGTGSLISFALYHFFSSEDLPLFRFVQKSFQHGFFLALTLVSLLLLRAEGLLTIWTFMLLALVLLFGIFFQFSLKKI